VTSDEGQGPCGKDWDYCDCASYTVILITESSRNWELNEMYSVIGTCTTQFEAREIMLATVDEMKMKGAKQYTSVDKLQNGIITLFWSHGDDWVKHRIIGIRVSDED